MMFDETRLVDMDELLPAAGRRILELQKEFDVNAMSAVVPADIEVTLKDRDTPVRQQEGPKCTAWAMVAALENLMNKTVDLSETHMWRLQRKRQNIEASVLAASQWVAEENDANWEGRCRLAAFHSLGYDWDGLVAAIDAEHPLVVGFTTPRDLGGHNPVIEAASKLSKGGHAVAVVGYRILEGRRYFLVKNSWGLVGDMYGYYWIAWNLYGATSSGYAYFYECVAVEDRFSGWGFDGDRGTIGKGAIIRGPTGSAVYRVVGDPELKTEIVRVRNERTLRS